MNISRLLSLMILAAAALSAQSWSQPVREVEKEARSAVRGYCQTLTVQSGAAGTGGPCQLIPLLGGASLNKVPADKILVIEDVNIYCTKHSSDAFRIIRLQPSLYFRDFALTLRYTNGSQQQFWSGSYAVRMYGKPDSPVTVSMDTGENVSAPASCSFDFVGHLVTLQ